MTLKVYYNKKRNLEIVIIDALYAYEGTSESTHKSSAEDLRQIGTCDTAMEIGDINNF
jgi:hypothetical protein